MDKIFILYEPINFETGEEGIPFLWGVTAKSMYEAARILGGELDRQKNKSIIWFPADNFIETYGGKKFIGLSYHRSHYPKSVETELDFNKMKWRVGESIVPLGPVALFTDVKRDKIGFLIREVPLFPSVATTV